MRLVTLFVHLFLLLLAQRLPAQSPTDTFPCMPKLRFVVIGSSTAAGAGASQPDSAWVNRYRIFLQALNPANEVINLAMGGYSSYQLLPSSAAVPNYRPHPDPERNITRALSLAPDAILLNLPSNDAASGYSLDEQLANFETIVQHSR
ncbi:MAG: SGNH/GDSL hydrolase family protein, partial [Saprospiraceae bacterium]|nr:SGNH/GDSL hydrolase family protein [Saprospiraceae bacterium]